jgi:hypothetical protein
MLSAWTSPVGCSTSRVGGADLLSGGTTIFGILKCSFGGGTSTEILVTIDYDSGTVVEIGTTAVDMDALAIR